MLTLKDLENVDDGGSWKKLKEEVEAETNNTSQMEANLTWKVVEGLIKRLAKDKRMTIEKNGSNCYPESINHSSFHEEKEDCLTRKQKKQKTGNNDKKQKQKKNYLTRKQTKQKTGNNDKKQKQKQKQKIPNNPIVVFTALGLEPPPDMSEVFKNFIENLGGTEIKLVIQKFIQVSDLKRSLNRFSMPMNQVRSKFLREAEEEKLENKEVIEVVFVEPYLKVSKLQFYKWQIGASDSYIFKDEWKYIVRDNADSLKPMAVVQIWSFRVGSESQLGFAMIKVRGREDGHVIN